MCLLQEYVRERQGDPSTTVPPPNPLMMGMDAGGYVLKAVGSVKVRTLSPLIDSDVRVYCRHVTQLAVPAYFPGFRHQLAEPNLHPSVGNQICVLLTCVDDSQNVSTLHAMQCPFEGSNVLVVVTCLAECCDMLLHSQSQQGYLSAWTPV